jgi:glycosyltransferase involved in cell wall biosynthesis
MHTPLVSVGISFLNCEKYLLDSIRSIFAQTFEDWELILVDDGSTDASLRLAQSIVDQRVRVLPPDGENKGLASRLNQIAQAARGEFIARMDADDLSHPQRFACQLQLLKDRPKVDVVGTSSYVLDYDRRPLRALTVPQTHEAIFQEKFRNISLVHPTIMASSSWFRRFPYNESLTLSQDYELWLRSSDKSVFANIPKFLFFKDVLSSFSPTKYVKSKLTGAKLIRPQLDRKAWLAELARRFRQMAVYTAHSMVGLGHLPVQRRYQPLTPQERLQAEQVLDAIKKTHVPIRADNENERPSKHDRDILRYFT